MIETALIDGDIICYRCAAACENETEDIARHQTSEMMRRMLHETNAMQHRCFLTGNDNFRYSIYPDYKAHRKDLPKPKWLQQVREHLVTHWGASVTEGIEADDALGIAQCEGDGNTIIITLDKDLLMIPGHHYTFETSGTSVKGTKWSKPAVFQMISPLEGLRRFYYQLIMGDRADNIPGYDGKMRQTIPQFLQDKVDFLEQCMTEQEMFEHVRAMYNDDERLLLSGQCLWIWRKDDDVWNFPKETQMSVH